MDRKLLVERIVEVLSADDRVLAIWLAGSLGRGRGDEFSDIDLVVAADPSRRDALVDEWDEIADRIAPIVHRHKLSGRTMAVFAHVTDEWDRFDVTVVSPPMSHVAADLTPLHDPDGLHASLPETAEAPPDRSGELAAEFLRVLGLLPVVVGRKEWVVGASGAGLLRGMLIQLMLSTVPERGGALRMRGILPDEQIDALAALPPIEATEESVVAVHLACARMFLPLARELAGEAYPVEMDRALRTHLDRALGLGI
ncbi:MAG TPA: nucleotidyltransferase domain-containing protein [Micromonosporaceae bacterium]